MATSSSCERAANTTDDEHAGCPLPTRRLLSRDEASSYLGLGSRLLSELIHLGVVPVVRIGGVASKRPRTLIDVRDLDTIVDGVKLAGGVDEYLAKLDNTTAKISAAGVTCDDGNN